MSRARLLRIAPALVVASALAATLVPSANAGPPAKVCRHLTAEQCEIALGAYSAYQFLQREVLAGLRARHRRARSAGGECGPTPHHRLRFYRCTIAFERPPMPAPCIVEALLYQPKGSDFQFRWRKESASCGA